MALRWYSVVVDSHDIAAQARWWAQVLDFVIVYEDEHEVAVIPKHLSVDPITDAGEWMRQPQGLVFVPVPEGKTVKNRLHIDLARTPARTATPRSPGCSRWVRRGRRGPERRRHVDGAGRPGGQRVLRALLARPLSLPLGSHEPHTVSPGMHPMHRFVLNG